MTPKPIWYENGKVYIIDQRLLPLEEKTVEIKNVTEMWEAIKTLTVRGAPAIGLAAAFGIYLGIKDFEGNIESFKNKVLKSGDYLATSRPTAVNLFWAADRIKDFTCKIETTDVYLAKSFILQEALKMLDEDIDTCRRIGVHGSVLFENVKSVLTHCNAGAMATSQYGTALSPIYVLHERNKKIHVYSDETRPLLQGSRITAWELSKAGIEVTCVCDSMAGVLMKKRMVEAVVTGADRIAKNGDTANKIGTYTLAVLAKEHGIPFYIAAPFSTVDFSTETGDEIPVEERNPDEVRCFGGRFTAPPGVDVYNPAFDVTPFEYITAFITEKGIVYPNFTINLYKLFTQEAV